MGFGKDGKIGNTQILVGLMIDQYKQPIGYEIYHGARFEGHTLKESIEKLKRKYQIGKVIVVADRARSTRITLKPLQKRILLIISLESASKHCPSRFSKDSGSKKLPERVDHER